MDPSSSSSSSPTKRNRGSSDSSRRRRPKVDSWQRYLDLDDTVITAKWDGLWARGAIKKTQHSNVEGECWECSLATTGTGYCQLQLNGSGYGKLQGYYLVHLWSMRRHGLIPTRQEFQEKDLDCSHLCHNKRCCNPDHLKWEDGRNNKRRNICPYRIEGGVRVCQYLHYGPACKAAHSRFEKNGVALFTGYDA